MYDGICVFNGHLFNGKGEVNPIHLSNCENNMTVVKPQSIALSYGTGSFALTH